MPSHPISAQIGIAINHWLSSVSGIKIAPKGITSNGAHNSALRLMWARYFTL
ncbi:hypothetical protein O9929_16225 [Vibrio lentus]|nr:hypothetical protein [Vibrio lentus]